MPADQGPCDWQVIPSGIKWSMASCLRLSEWDLPLMLEVRVHEPIPAEDASDLDPRSKGWPQVLDLHNICDPA